MANFSSLSEAPADPIFGVTAAFNADTRASKVNLGVGIYRTADLKTVLLNTVDQAEQNLATQHIPRPYLPMGGDEQFVAALGKLIFATVPDRVVGVQTVGSTGGLMLIGELLKKQLGHDTIYVSDPTWANHYGIFAGSGLEVATYPYYDRSTCQLGLEECLSGLGKLPEGSAVLLHACCHNPTGVDPTLEEWRAILDVVQKRRLLPIFDCAYQGFANGVAEDVASIRLFLEAGVDLFVSYSCAKNFGLYAERTGALYVATQSAQEAHIVGSQINAIVRRIYSNPPAHGAWVVKAILGSKQATAEWEEEVAAMRTRLQEMRRALMAGLMSKTDDLDFNFIGKQHGLFSYIGLSKDQVSRLQGDYAIYTPGSGRINVAGLNSDNLDYVTEAIAAVL